ncbi:MAG: hypothetical protein KUG59_04400 [Parvibaculaceae bacterium]|nr:hypothetical protein [Parvibaculaceae bacterium]
MLRLTDEDVFSWDHWIVVRLTGVPLVAGSIIALCLISSFVAIALLFNVYGPDGQLAALSAADRMAALGTDSVRFGSDPYSWAAMVSSLLGGYGIAVTAFAVAKEKSELPALAEMLGRDVEEMVQLRNETNLLFQEKAPLFGWLGYFVGLICMATTLPGFSSYFGMPSIDDGRALFPFEWAAEIWFLIFVPLMFYMMGKGMYFTIREARFLSTQQKLHHKIDIWHPERVRVLTRLAMARALFWLIGSTIGSLFFLEESINPVALFPVFGGIGLVASLLLAMPVFRLHFAFKQAKEEELVRVRDVIKKNWDKLQGTPTDEVMIARLGGLVAFEQRIEAVSEWPLDLSTLSRFSLYLAIPMVSWIGGALVEQVVDGAIN